jgi:CRP-like cAMP-binding protein
VTTYKARQAIIYEGEESNLFGTLRQGWAYRYKNIGNGRRQILGFILPGDAMTLEMLTFGNLPLPFGVSALSPATVCWFPLEEMTELLRRKGPQDEHSKQMVHGYFNWLIRRNSAMGHTSAASSLAELLLQLMVRLKRCGMVSGNEYDFAPTQADLADSLGLTTIHVNRLLGGMKRQGILQIEGKKMQVFDKVQLRRIVTQG